MNKWVPYTGVLTTVGLLLFLSGLIYMGLIEVLVTQKALVYGILGLLRFLWFWGSSIYGGG